MPRKIMRTLWDIDDEIHRETMSPQPLLTDDYTYGNVNDLVDQMPDGTPDGEEADLITDENQDGIPDDMQNIDKTNYDVDPDYLDDCGCK